MFPICGRAMGGLQKYVLRECLTSLFPRLFTFFLEAGKLLRFVAVNHSLYLAITQHVDIFK